MMGERASLPLDRAETPGLVISYHTRQAFSRTMACPLWQPNAFANSAMFDTTLLTRYLSNGCGLR
jgi:hypothetical protein